MFETNSKFPKIFVYMMSLIAVIILCGMFFSLKIVGGAYFIALLILAVIFILDKKYGSILTNYKVTYLLFEIVNLFATLSIVAYEYAKHTEVLNVFLILLGLVEVVMIILDIFLLKNKHLTKTKNVIIDFVKLCSMVCLITYFFNVSKLYFAIFAFMFEVVNIAVKVITFYENRSKKEVVEKPVDKIEDIIHSSVDDEDGE